MTLTKLAKILLVIVVGVILLSLFPKSFQDARNAVSKVVEIKESGVEEIKAVKPVIPESEKTEIDKLVSAVKSLVASSDTLCFLNYGGLPAFGEKGTTLKFTKEREKTVLEITGGAGGHNTITTVDIPDMQPCVIGGPGVAENFYKSFIDQEVKQGEERRLYGPYHTPVSEIHIAHDDPTVGSAANRIKYGSKFIDFEDNGWLFKSNDGSICFFPTVLLGNDDDGLNNDNVDKLDTLVGKSLKKCDRVVPKIKVKYGFYDPLGYKEVGLTYFYSPGLDAWTSEGKKLHSIFTQIDTDLQGRTEEQGYTYFRNFEVPKPWAIRELSGIPAPARKELTSFSIDFAEGETILVYDRNEGEWMYATLEDGRLVDWKPVVKDATVEDSFYFFLDVLGDLGEEDGGKFINSVKDGKLGDDTEVEYYVKFSDTGDTYFRFDDVRQKWMYRIPPTGDSEGVWLPTPNNDEQASIFYRLLLELGQKNFDEGEKLLGSFVGTHVSGSEPVTKLTQQDILSYIFPFESPGKIYFAYRSITFGPQGKARWFYAYDDNGDPGLWIQVPVDKTGQSTRDQVFSHLPRNEVNGEKYLHSLNLHNVDSIISAVPLYPGDEVQS